MELRKLIAAGAVAGALAFGGTAIANAQEDGSTTTTEAPAQDDGTQNNNNSNSDDSTATDESQDREGCPDKAESGATDDSSSDTATGSSTAL